MNGVDQRHPGLFTDTDTDTDASADGKATPHDLKRVETMTRFSDGDYERMARAIDASDDSLFSAIGRRVIQLENATLGMAPDDESTTTRADQEQRGRRWFESHLEGIRSTICSNSKLLDEVSQLGTDDRQTLGLLIADAIAGSVIGIPPFFISALIIKIGLKELCGPAGVRE